RAAEPEVIACIRQVFVSVASEAYAGCCEALADMDLREDITSISAPTLVIAGSEDPATPPKHAREIAERIPQARLEIVGGGRHLSNIERADEVNRLLLEHLTTEEASE